jgi:hypothetical protein
MPLGRSVTIHEKIQAYYSGMSNEHHRYRSWEHCYRYFHSASRESIEADRDQAALRLGFYLASWGMYRGSSFLLQYAYTIHRGVIDRLLVPTLAVLWDRDFGAGEGDEELIPVILEAVRAIREAYKPFVTETQPGQPTHTLVTKILLGTLGCMPACDRFFVDGLKRSGLAYSRGNGKFIEGLLRFTKEHVRELREEQDRIEFAGGLRYPLMKLVDMYFWQIGFERSFPNLELAQVFGSE